MKQCITCGEVKPLTEFYQTRGKPMPRCKPCHREWRWKGPAPGETKPVRKLTEADIKQIRYLLAEAKHHREMAIRLTLKAIAEKFEVSKQTVCEIGQLRAWKDV